MPPWHASTTEGGPFHDARVMTAEEIGLLASWVSGGCPEGSPGDAARPAVFQDGWRLGTPDLVLSVKEAYTLGASGPDEFRVFVLPSELTEGKWVTAVDFKPGNRKIVHHMLGAYDTSGQARKFDKEDPLSGYKVFSGFGSTPTGLPFFPGGGLSGWAPGKRAHPLPVGVGRYLPPGADVLLQVHYHKSGKIETDASSVGLYFAKGSIEKQMVLGMLTPPRRLLRPALDIPAGDPNALARGTLELEEPFHLVAIIPHMHWLGKDFLVTATFPDGTRRTLVKIDHWDFNWQDTYDFVEPVPLPGGTRLEVVAHYDNSESNPANPSRPPVKVTWGEETTNEMCIAFLQLTCDGEKLTGNGPPPNRPRPIISFVPGMGNAELNRNRDARKPAAKP